jgi:hypothetical protein
VSDEFITIARFSTAMEAQLAVGRLEAEGIKAYLLGDLTVSVFTGMGVAGGQVHLQVTTSDRERAIKILEECAADALDEGWKSQNEEDSAVWVCPLCGDAVRVILPVCPSCHTLRGSTPEAEDYGAEAIQDAPSPPGRRRPKPRSKPSPEGVQKLAEPSVQPPLPPAGEAEEEIEVPELATFQGDDLARRALRATLFGLGVPILFPFAVFNLFHLLFYDGELSPRGRRNFYLTLTIQGAVFVFLLVLCAGLAL